MKVKKGIAVYSLVVFILLFAACGQDYHPKPRGYFRIDLPEKNYIALEQDFPYTFEYPVYAQTQIRTDELAEPYWMNLYFPKYKGTIYLSYHPIENNLDTLIEDANFFVNKHIPKAREIGQEVYVDEDNRVFGLYYDIKGSGTASPINFYLTDSLDHYIRGSLYFYSIPNNDSLSPVIDFLEEDIKHLMESFRWK